jgi:hypothetical protein
MAAEEGVTVDQGGREGGVREDVMAADEGGEKEKEEEGEEQ